MTSFNLAFQMTKLSLLNIVRDRRGLVMVLVMPILLTAILSMALGPLFGGKSIPAFPVSIYNADISTVNDVRAAQGLSGSFTEALTKSGTVSKVIEERSKQLALQDVSSGRADVAIIIPKDFTKRMMEGKAALVEIDSATNALTKRSIVQAVMNAYGQQAAVIRYKMMASQGKLTPQEAMQPSVVVTQKDAGMHGLTAGSFYAVGMMVMFMLTNASSRANAMVNERQSDTYKRLVASPAPRFVLGLGYWMAQFLVLFLQGGLLLLVSHFFLGIYVGRWDELLAVLVAYSASMAGIAVVLGSYVKSTQMMDIVGTIGSQIIAVLGGSIFPLAAFPKALQWFAKVLPNGQAVHAMTNVVIGIPFHDLAATIAYLVGIGVLLGVIGGARIGRPIA